MRRDVQNSHHLATISFDGRFWDAYLELAESPGPGQPARGRIAFSAADAGDADPVRTTTIFIEDTPQDVVVRAREFKTHQLVALLRSAIPPEAMAGARDRASELGEPDGGTPDTGTDGTTAPSAEPGPGPDAPRDDQTPAPGADRSQGEPADEL